MCVRFIRGGARFIIGVGSTKSACYRPTNNILKPCWWCCFKNPKNIGTAAVVVNKLVDVHTIVVINWFI